MYFYAVHTRHLVEGDASATLLINLHIVRRVDRTNNVVHVQFTDGTIDRFAFTDATHAKYMCSDIRNAR